MYATLHDSILQCNSGGNERERFAVYITLTPNLVNLGVLGELIYLNVSYEGARLGSSAVYRCLHRTIRNHYQLPPPIQGTSRVDRSILLLVPDSPLPAPFP